MSAMSFDVAADAYDRFIGRYSRVLSPRFLEFAQIAAGPVLDVGCGPGSLTSVLAERFGAAGVAAVDPSEPFVAACRARVPGADVRRAPAEELPFADGAFGAALSQLVLSFVRDAGRAAAEMRRVTRTGGVVAACSFEANGFELARVCGEAGRRFDQAAPDDTRLPFRRMPELVALWERGGFHDIATGTIVIEAGYAGFDDFWSPLAVGVGPAAGYLVGQSEERRAAIRDACFEILGRPSSSFSLSARCLAIRGRV